MSKLVSFLSRSRQMPSINLTRVCNRSLEAAFIAGQPTRCITNWKYIGKEEPLPELRQRFINAFKDSNLDGWWLRQHLGDLQLEDYIPEPEVMEAAFHACRNCNEIALAIRLQEAVHAKCVAHPKLWTELMSAVEPTMKQLGIPTLAQLGYDKPELAYLGPDED